MSAVPEWSSRWPHGATNRSRSPAPWNGQLTFGRDWLVHHLAPAHRKEDAVEAGRAVQGQAVGAPGPSPLPRRRAVEQNEYLAQEVLP